MNHESLCIMCNEDLNFILPLNAGFYDSNESEVVNNLIKIILLRCNVFESLTWYRLFLHPVNKFLSSVFRVARAQCIKFS